MASDIDIDKDGEEILRICSYHRNDYDLCLVRTRPHNLQPIAARLQAPPFDTRPEAALGALDRLSPEILLEILLNLDLPTYLRFRQVNRRARIVATRLREYDLVSKHGVEGLVALFRTKLAEKFTLNDLYEALLKHDCEFRTSFGGFMSLFECTRCCFQCLVEEPKLRAVAPFYTDELCQAAGVSKSGKPFGPALQFAPGRYRLGNFMNRGPYRQLVSLPRVMSTVTSLGLSRDAIRTVLPEDSVFDYRQYASATAYPWYDAEKAEVDRGVSCKGIQLYIEKHHRFRIRLAMGSHLRYTDPEIDHRDLVFSQAGFLEHFKTCRHAQDLWRRTKDGAELEPESRFMRQGGKLVVVDNNGGVPY